MKSHARCIGIDAKRRIIRDHSNYKQAKKTKQKKSSTNKHCGESRKVDSASIINETTMSSNDGVAGKGDQDETADTTCADGEEEMAIMGLLMLNIFSR